MNIDNRIELLTELGERLDAGGEHLEKTKQKAWEENKWFTKKNIDKSINAIKEKYLDKNELEKWVAKYGVAKENTGINTGLIMAGNIPLVGFHDLLSVFVTGHNAKIKLSSKDKVLMQYIISLMHEIDPETTKLIQTQERLKDFDAVIATGSNNSFRYFEYYFSKYPHLLRKNRNSTAVLTGNESDEELALLSCDILDYFGLGCRNVSKIYVPKGYDFKRLLDIIDKNHQDLKQHNKYMNNYDYNLALSLLNNDKIYQGEVIFAKEDISYLSRIASFHYEEYDNLEEVKKRIKNDEPLLQLAASPTGKMLDFEREVKFGQSQKPALDDYADGVDTMDFLVKLKK